MPPQEAPTTIRPEGNSLPSPPVPPRRGPTPRNRGEEASGVGEKGGRTAGGNRTQESRYQSVSKKRGGGVIRGVWGERVEPRSHLGM